MISLTSFTQLIIFSYFLLLSNISSIPLFSQEEERTTLLALKYALADNSDSISSSWIPNTDYCDWIGVRCDPSTGHVIEVNLNEKQLAGELPSNLSSSTLPMLSILDLSTNNISGVIPIWIFELPSLRTLNLKENHFISFIRSNTFSVLSPLEVFQLDNNKLQGSIPKPILEIKSLQKLTVEGNKLSGTIRLTELYKLQRLKVLTLSKNKLSLVDDTFNNTDAQVVSSWPQFISLGFSSCNLDEFPRFLIGQSNLSVLDLSNNRLRGEVPKWVFLVARETMNILDLSQNALTGTLNHLPWPNLKQLDLHSNQFHGPIPSLPTTMIPSLICELSSISLLDLSNNSFTGELPTCLVNIVSNKLLVLDLSQNQFSGSIPPVIFETCGNLTILRLSSNLFVGQIPESLAKCSQLQLLDLRNNNLRDTFPHWLDTLSALKVLRLTSNHIYGSLLHSSNATISYPNLLFFDLSNNQISGNLSDSFLRRFTAMIDRRSGGDYQDVPYSYYSILTPLGRYEIILKIHLVIFDVSNNQLQGSIPDVIGELTSLLWLDLSNNYFTGYIPPILGNLSNLESLDLSNNSFNGSIPNSLEELSFLSNFNVSFNNFVGPVPTAYQFSTFQYDSYLGNPRLCGPPLINKCSCDEEEDHSSFPFDLNIIILG